jgi:hypothetical protein
MSLAAYPNGLTDLCKTTEWRDTVAMLLKDMRLEPTEEAIASPPDEIKKNAVGEVLRALHARHAGDLPLAKWSLREGGESEFLIDDSDLRAFYGPLIGRIAKSHNDPISRIAAVGRPLGAFGNAPSEWSVDPIKIACLLRTADAAHIDGRRAPRFLRTLLLPEKVAALHWTFLEKLAKPRLEGDALVYSSGPDFTLAEADAW